VSIQIGGSKMHPTLAKVFSDFTGYEIGIIGSAARDVDSAKDIDILFLDARQFMDACDAFNVKWSGWDAHTGHVRRANVVSSAVSKPLQLLQVGSTPTFASHPYCVVLRDGTRLHDGLYYAKTDGWRYDKVVKVDRRKESKKVIAIDFDGTIRDWETSKPFPHVKDSINLFRERGYKVLVYSANDPDWVERWLYDYDIRFDSIWRSSGKPVASIYIDDRGFRFTGDWDLDTHDILEILEADGET
jgi:hypothetical protein